MKKNIIYIIILLLHYMLYYAVPIHAQSTEEIQASELLKESFKIISSSEVKRYPQIIDYSIEIIKIVPNSIHSKYVMNCLFKVIRSNDYNMFVTKFNFLYNNFYSEINDFKNNFAEKLILLFMMFHGYSLDMAEENCKANYEISKKILLNLESEYSDRKISALATMILEFDCIDDSVKYCEYFKENFPNHNAIPLIDLSLIINKYFVKLSDYNTFIKEAEILAEKYSNVSSPLGYRLVIEYYAMILKSFVELKNFEKAKEYLDLIKKEAPNYWDLANLEKEVNNLYHKQDK